jgi:uncharacterized membrane protein YwzB
MKKKMINIIVAILLIVITSIFWNIPRIKYDVNRDGKVSVADLIKLQKYYLDN